MPPPALRIAFDQHVVAAIQENQLHLHPDSSQFGEHVGHVGKVGALIAHVDTYGDAPVRNGAVLDDCIDQLRQ